MLMLGHSAETRSGISAAQAQGLLLPHTPLTAMHFLQVHEAARG
jgi:hypothetical protein